MDTLLAGTTCHVVNIFATSALITPIEGKTTCSSHWKDIMMQQIQDKSGVSRLLPQ